MATNEQIKLDIVSGFDPGGFVKANNAVKGLGSEMKKGSKVADQLMTAFGSGDGAVGQFAGTINKLGAAFKGGGWIALAVAGVAFLATKFMEAREAAKKLAEEQRKTWSDDLLKKSESILEGIKTKHAQISDEIERGAKAAEKIAKAYEGLAKSEVSLQNAQTDKTVSLLEGEKQSALSGESDPVKRKQIEINYERQILEVKKEASKFERDQKASMAQENVTLAEKQLSTEKQKLSELSARAEELKSFLGNDALTEFNKKNPMPTQPTSSLTGLGKAGAAMGIAGAAGWGVKSQLDQKDYDDKMAAWMKESMEFSKENEPKQKSAAQELARIETEMKSAPSSIREREIALSAAKNERGAVTDQNEAASTREAIQQTALSEKQIAFDKAQEEYQKALDKRTKVEERITKQEEKIEKLKEKERDRQDKQKIWQQNAQQAQQLGAAGWNQKQMDAADAQEQLGKDNKREAKWVDEAKKRIARGTKLSKDDMARLANFDDWKKLQGPNPFDPGKAAADQLKAMNANLAEIKALNQKLDQSLRIN